MEYIVLLIVVIAFGGMLLFTLKGAEEKRRKRWEEEKQLILSSNKIAAGNASPKVHSRRSSAEYLIKKYQGEIAKNSATFKLSGVDAYLKLFIERLPEMEIFSHFSNYKVVEKEVGKYDGFLIIEGILDNGEQSWMQLNWIWDTYDAYTNSKAMKEVNKANGGKTQVRVVTQVYVVYPSTFESAAKFEALTALMEQAKAKKRVSKEVHMARIYDVVKPQYKASLELRARTYPLESQVADEHLDLFYDPVQFMLESSTYTIPMGKFLPLSVMWLLAERPVAQAFYGLPGVGKTRLMDHLAYTVGQDPSVRLISCDDTLFSLIESPTFKGISTNIFNPQYRNILVFDQIEGVISDSKLRESFKRLLDSNFTRQHNLTMIATFNGNPAEHADGIFRFNRCLPIELLPLKAEKKKIEDLVEVISKMPKIEGELQAKILSDKIADQSNSGVGEITIGEVFTCFQPAILNFQEELKKDLEKVQEPTIKVGDKVELEILGGKVSKSAAPKGKRLSRAQKKAARGKAKRNLNKK